MQSKILKIFAPLLIAVALLAAGCVGGDIPPKQTDPITDPATDPMTDPVTDPITDPATEPVTEPVTDPATEPVTEPVTDPVTDPPIVNTDAVLPSEFSYTYGENYIGTLINSLTGLPAAPGSATARPVAILIDNASSACPQNGIGSADVIYEMLTEGGVTRLMMLVSNYSALGTIGAVRSTRDYFIDISQDYDAIHVHAGGSDEAYRDLHARPVAHLDETNGDGVASYRAFTRNPGRVAGMTFPSIHSIVTSGKGLDAGISYLKIRTSIKNGQVSPLNFVDCDGGTIKYGSSASKIVLRYTSYNTPTYTYDTATRTYSRTQFSGRQHIDGSTGEQLSFTNVLVLSMKHTNLNDELLHIAIGTTGSGSGYCFTNGTYTEIVWSKASVDTPMVLKTADGDPLYLNCGKTFVNIVSPAMLENMVIG